MATKFDTRQSIQKTGLPMVGSAAGAQLDTILPVIDAELGKLFEDRNILLSGGGTITYTVGDQITVTEALALEVNQKVAGGSPTSISLGASAWTFSANGRMAYAVINRLAGTATVTSDATALPAAVGANQEVFLIAKRVDTSGGGKRIYFRNGLMLPIGSSSVIGGGTSASVLAFTGMDSDTDSTPDYAASVAHTLRFIQENSSLENAISRLDDQMDKALGQLRIKPGPSSFRAQITGADVTMLDTSVRGQMLSNLRLAFTGAQISFAGGDAGTIYAADGTTPLGVNFTMTAPANGLYRWYSITLIPGATNADGSIGGQLIVVPGSSDNASAALANKPAFADGIPLGYISILGLGGTIDSIGYNNIVQMGIGSGGGGSGSGSGSPLDPDQESTYLYYTRSDFAVDKKQFVASITGASDQVLGLKKITFTAAGQVVTTTNLNGPQVTAEALPVLNVQARLLYTVGKVDLPTVEFTRDGTVWFPATVEKLSSAGNTVLASLTFTDAEPVTLNLRMRITSSALAVSVGGAELLGFGLNYVPDTTLVLAGDASYEQRTITSTEASTGLVTLNSVRYTPGTHQLMVNVNGHTYMAPDFSEAGPGQVQFVSGALNTGDVVKFYTGFGLVDGNSITLAKIAALDEAIVGSSAQVSAGVAQYSTIQAGINAVANGGRVKVLKGSYTENLTITKECFIEGQGRSTLINGTVALNSGATGSLVKYVKFGDNVTIAVAVSNAILSDCWAAAGKTISDNGTSNLILVSGE